MPNVLKEKIKKDNSLINFFKIPEELIGEKFGKDKLEEIDEKIFYYLTEEYTKAYNQSLFKAILRDNFYKLKPIIPRYIQIKLRKKYVHFQRKNQFPSWPIDLTLYDVYQKGIRELFNPSNFTEIPFINFWPNDK